MKEDRFEAERRRLRREMQAAIDEVRATYERRLDAVDRAEELMKFAASGEVDSPGAGTGAGVEAGATVAVAVPGALREELARFVAGRSEPFSSADVEARFPDVPPQELRTCLGQMARDGVVSIVEPGETGQPTQYEVPEPDYAGVPRGSIPPAGD